MKDLFSAHASEYAQYRPTYPESLYDWVLKKVAAFDTAWDCGTGNGQVASVLASHFKQVIATDISAAQLAQAPALTNVRYEVCPAEVTPFDAETFDLITVGQALHWFQFEAFHQEVKRVAKPGAILAVWTYQLIEITPAIDTLITHFYTTTIGEYWDKERAHVENRYAEIPFPYKKVETAIFPQTYDWTLIQLCNYLRTWSSVKKYERIHQIDPVLALEQQLIPLWDINSSQKVTFPVFVKVGQV